MHEGWGMDAVILQDRFSPMPVVQQADLSRLPAGYSMHPS